MRPSTSNLERRNGFYPFQGLQLLRLLMPYTRPTPSPTLPGSPSQYLRRCVSQLTGMAHRR